VLALIGFATVATAGAYACRAYYFGPGSTQTSAAPSQSKPAQPGIRGAPPAAAGSGYVVQVSAQRSKADAEASFRSLQDKFPIQLGGRTATVKRADLGAKGIYYRAMVGPFASAGDASQFCGRLKAAGGQCVIQRN
jgi:cell division septation protein DedD